MNSVYVRLAAYGLTTIAAMIPMAWLDWGVSYDAASHVLSVNLDALAAAVATSGIANLAIFRKWGVK